jgi:ribosomal protein S18 acetylase RimI-like enzyme
VALPEGVIIRKYEPRDREAVRGLCCATGFLGKPIDPAFEDRELFADYLTSYYTDCEPESSMVVEMDGQVKGYLLGSRKPLRQQVHGFFLNFSLFVRGMRRYWTYSKASRDFIGWILRNSWREVPAAPRRTAHFHINALPEAQAVAIARELIGRYLNYLRAAGEKAVYGQMVTFESRRGARLFERYGFQVLEKREITKYRKLHPEPVYLTTVVKQLDEEPEHTPLQVVSR